MGCRITEGCNMSPHISSDGISSAQVASSGPNGHRANRILEENEMDHLLAIAMACVTYSETAMCSNLRRMPEPVLTTSELLLRWKGPA
eukprot:13606706-Alexandrium_andersonii.AAC.1